mgnify:CR=1 FL=1
MIKSLAILIFVTTFLAGVYIYYPFSKEEIVSTQPSEIEDVGYRETEITQNSEVAETAENNSMSAAETEKTEVVSVSIDGSLSKFIKVDTVERSAEQVIPTSGLICNKSINKSNIKKPKGVFTSVLTDKAVKNGADIMIWWTDSSRVGPA